MTSGDLRAALRQAAAALGEAGIASPLVDARLIAAQLLGCEPLELFTHDEVPAGFADAIRRRSRREPLQWITGRAAFGPLDIAVGPGVFIPRPETEILADWAARTAAEMPRPTVVELCAGSAAMSCYIAHAVPQAHVHALEISADALEWARRGVADLGLDAAVTLHQGDATASDALGELSGGVDIVVANPPYVPDHGAVAPEVGFDPDVAVYGGADGLDIVRGLIPTATRLLRPGGTFGFEHDDTASESVRTLLEARGSFTDVRALADLAGVNRFVLATKL